MAAHLSKVAKRVKITDIFLLAICAAGGIAQAQNLADPTRPPATTEATPERSAASVAGPVLQSVLISPSRKMAIINGQSVNLGEKFGEARLVKISESEVVLRNGQEVQILKLFPNVQKSLNPGRASAKPESPQQ